MPPGTLISHTCDRLRTYVKMPTHVRDLPDAPMFSGHVTYVRF